MRAGYQSMSSFENITRHLSSFTAISKKTVAHIGTRVHKGNVYGKEVFGSLFANGSVWVRNPFTETAVWTKLAQTLLDGW